MRRLLLITVAVFVAAGLAVSVSLVAASGARSQEASEPYTQVVDNATEGRFEAPGWETRAATPDSYGADYSVAEPIEGGEPARFKVNIPETGEYTVFARWPASETHNVSTVFEVSTASGVESVEVDQQSSGGQWVKLGTYTMEAGDSWAVSVSRVDFFKDLVVADAIQVVQGTQEGISGTLGATSSDMLAASRARGTGVKAWRSGKRFLGVPYRFERCSVRDGMDCSCLTKRAFAPWKTLPDDPNRQFNYGRRIGRSHIKTGDLLFFNQKSNVPGIDHVGIAGPRGKILHASTFCNKVCTTQRRYIMDDFVGAKRLLRSR